MEATREKSSATRSPLKEIALYFLKLGFLGFGGPLALIAAYQKDLVEERRWISEERFSRTFALIKAMPGAAATQLAAYLGNARGGKLGGVLAAICLIAPAFLMMLLLGAFYTSVETLSWSKPFLFGMQTAALGVIADSVWKLTKPYRKECAFWGLAAVALVLTAWRQSLEPVVIIGSGLVGVLFHRLRGGTRVLSAMVPLPLLVGAHVFHGGVLLQLAAVCLKASLLVFGTGLAIVPLLAQDIVYRLHWLDSRQFMDALAFGQITPGPVLITTTFIGYKVAGVLGAVVATICMFGPGVFNILTWFPVAEKRLGGSPYTRQFVMCAVGAVTGSIVAALFRLAAESAGAGNPLLGGAIGMLALGVISWSRIPVWIVIPAGGILSAAFSIHS